MVEYLGDHSVSSQSQPQSRSVTDLSTTPESLRSRQSRQSTVGARFYDEPPPKNGSSSYGSSGHGSGTIVGAATAGSRALVSQLLTFYLRVPVKLFKPTRVDYMVLPRLINPVYNAKPWNFFTHSNPALLYHAVKEYGWNIIPNHVLPLLIANSAVGLVLYTTYLSSISILQDKKRSRDQSLSIRDTLVSGALAGGVQSLVAAPIDAVWTRFSASEVLRDVKHRTMWQYGWQKLTEIGVPGIFAGFTLSLVKESLAYSLYFSSFELIKSSGYKKYLSVFDPKEDYAGRPGGRALYPTFVLIGGAVASIALQVIHYPLGKVQKLHLMRLEAMDVVKHYKFRSLSPFFLWKMYLDAYYRTYKQMNRLRMKDAQGSWFKWLYGGFWRSALVSVPGSSVGLMVFEIMRVRYGDEVVFD